MTALLGWTARAIAAVFGVPTRPACEHGCGFKTRDASRMAAHIWFNHAGDRSVR